MHKDRFNCLGEILQNKTNKQGGEECSVVCSVLFSHYHKLVKSSEIRKYLTIEQKPHYHQTLEALKQMLTLSEVSVSSIFLLNQDKINK